MSSPRILIVAGAALTLVLFQTGRAQHRRCAMERCRPVCCGPSITYAGCCPTYNRTRRGRASCGYRCGRVDCGPPVVSYHNAQRCLADSGMAPGRSAPQPSATKPAEKQPSSSVVKAPETGEKKQVEPEQPAAPAKTEELAPSEPPASPPAQQPAEKQEPATPPAAPPSQQTVEKQEPAPPAEPPALPELIAKAQSLGNLKTFLSLADLAKLLDEARSGGPYTILAPDDSAFERLPAEEVEQLKANPDLLRKVVLHHVLTDAKLSSAELVKRATLVPLVPPELKVTKEGDAILVDGARIERADIECDRGVIHLIDKVLIPPQVAAALKEAKKPEPKAEK